MMRVARAGAGVLLAAMTAAGCAGSSEQKPLPSPESVPPPVNYKGQIATFLRTTLTDRADFRGALISAPTLKPVGQSQHYIVCLRFNGRGERKDKVVIYLGESIAQFLDSKPEQCAGAAFAPFQDLEDMTPPK